MRVRNGAKHLWMVFVCFVMVFGLLSWAEAAKTKAKWPEQLTFQGVNGEAYFSPDGTRLIYQSHKRPGHRHDQIYILDLKSKKETRIARHNGDNTCSYFHPKKKGEILFASTFEEVREHHKFKKFDPREVLRKAALAKKLGKKKRKGRRKYQWIYKPYEIYTYTDKGKMLKRLTHAPGYDAEGTYSPDGTKIIFSSRRDGDQELYIMNADGSGQRRLTWRRGNDGGAFISPNGKQVTWRSFDYRGNAQVMIADLHDGKLKNFKQLTHGKGIHWAPFWHPSGKYILFSSNHETSFDTRRNFDLYLIDVAGTCVKKLTTHTAPDVLPVFSPDGKWLAWTSKRVGNKSQIFRMPFVLPTGKKGCVNPKASFKKSQLLSFKGPAAHGHRSRRYRHYRRYRRSPHYKNPKMNRHYRRYYRRYRHAKGHHHKGHHHKPHAHKGQRKHHHKGHTKSHAHKGHYHKRHHHKGHHHGHHGKKPVSRPASRPTSRRVKPKKRFSKAALLQDLYFLSHPVLEGRDAGTMGIELAARYIAHRFQAMGLKPVFDRNTSFFQPFQVTTGVKLSKNNALSVAGAKTSWKVSRDFVPFGFSASGQHKGGVVFAGYGITDPGSRYDDYAGIDVKGKFVLLFRYTPRWGQRDKHPFGERRSMYAAFRYKFLNARSHGAKGVIMVDPPNAKEKKPPRLIPVRFSRGLSDAGILALHVKRSVAAKLLGGQTLAGLKADIDKTFKPASMALKATITAQISLQRTSEKVKNVAALLPGSDPAKAKEILVIGAHYDHLGHGHVGAFPGNRGKIHPGADDNASGTAVLIALARYFHQHPLPRPVLFVAFAGEERGLLGSAHFVQHPPVPRKHVMTMLNLDMVGRMRKKRLVVQGSMTSPAFVPLLQGVRRSMQRRGITLNIKLGPSGYGPSDHTSFYARKIPVLFFFTGAHTQYHRPTDTFDTLNIPGIIKVTHYVAQVTSRVARLRKRPAYRKVLSPLPRRKARGGMRVYLGSIPDYGSRTKGGVKLTGVRPGGPADKGGVKGGDIVVKIGRFTLQNLYDMVFALRYYRPGDVVNVVVKRGGKQVVCRVKLGARRSYSR